MTVSPTARQDRLAKWLAAVVELHSVHDHLVEAFVTSTTELLGVGSAAGRPELREVRRLEATGNGAAGAAGGGGEPAVEQRPLAPAIVGWVRRPDIPLGTIWYKIDLLGGARGRGDRAADGGRVSPTFCCADGAGADDRPNPVFGGGGGGGGEGSGGGGSVGSAMAPVNGQQPLLLERRYSDFLALKHQLKVAGLPRYSDLFPGKINVDDSRRLEMLRVWLQTVRCLSFFRGIYRCLPHCQLRTQSPLPPRCALHWSVPCATGTDLRAAWALRTQSGQVLHTGAAE